MNKSTTFLMVIVLILSTGFILNNEMINQIVVRLMEYANKNYQEKVYVHTDADVYYSGEIIWLSTRLLDAQSHTPSELSRVTHVKLFDSNKKELYHKKILIEDGTGYADIFLSDTLSTGIYQLRGYTEWMKNFSQEFFFHKQIYIINEKINLLDSLSEKEEDLDVGFFPEGGTFIASMSNKVGFKITNGQGNGENGSGYIINDQQDTIVQVSTYKFGIGSFSIKPMKGRSYYLYLNRGNNIKKFALPKAAEEGVHLTANVDASKNIEIELEASRKFIRQNKNLILILQCRGKVNFAAEGSLGRKNVVNIPRRKLEHGINQLTVFNEKGIPLVERLIFVQPDIASDLTISKLKKEYNKKELVEIDLTSTVSEEINVTISVHDRPPMSDNNIVNYLLLNSDLKGQIENPDYYFNDTDSARKAADLLMLSHGWRRFVWDKVLNDHSGKPAYPAENKGLTFRGRLIDKMTGEAVTNTSLIMSKLSKYPNFFFYKFSSNEEFVCVLPEMYGKEKIFVNLLGEENFKNLKLVHSTSYDTFQNELPRSYQPKVHIPIEDHFNLKKTEKLILDNYRIYKSDMFSVSEMQSDKDIFMVSGYLGYPNHEVSPEEYIPLKDLKEIVFELMSYAKIKKRKGKDEIFVYDESKLSIPTNEVYLYFHDKPATFFVNGIPIFDNEYVFNLKYQNIKKVEIYNSKIFNFIDYKFHGIVSITTKNFQLGKKTDLEEYSNFHEFEGLSIQREYYPFKVNDVNERVPDIRHLLYWNPNSTVKKDSTTTISFRTSDVQNNFYVKIEGMSKSGKPISKIQLFNVNKTY